MDYLFTWWVSLTKVYVIDILVQLITVQFMVPYKWGKGQEQKGDNDGSLNVRFIITKSTNFSHKVAFKYVYHVASNSLLMGSCVIIGYHISI